MTLPDGYAEERAGGASAFVVDGGAAWVREALGGGRTLHGWAAGRPGAEALSGRGTVYAVKAPMAGPDGRERWAVRHYRRGGRVAAPLLDDRYLALGTPRPLRELHASAAARARGVPTPAVVAGAVYPAGLFYRADLVTELVPGGRELSDVLFGRDVTAGREAAEGARPRSDTEGPAWSAETVLEAAADLARALEEAGVDHPDFNARNVLLTEGTGGAPRAWVLDLDRCAVHPPDGVPAPGRMGRRLLRSVVKIAGQRGAAVPEAAGTILTATGGREG